MLGNRIKNLLAKSIKASKTTTTNYPIPMRDFIHNKLYLNSSSYYNTKSSIGRLPNMLDFSEMKGISDYVTQLNKQYPKSTYLTCSELLKPYFGYAVGNYIIYSETFYSQDGKDGFKEADANKSNKPNIKIIEFGCGMGNILLNLGNAILFNFLIQRWSS